MLFRRRNKLTLAEKVRGWLWPRRSWRRSASYLKKRILRLNATPHAIAAGLACGVFSSFTPFVGFHFMIAFAIAYLVAGNMAAAALGCGLGGNPVTFGPIWASTYEVGHRLLDTPALDGRARPSLGFALHEMRLADIWGPILKPMLVGAVPLGLAFAFVTYAIVFVATRQFQHRRALAVAARRASVRRAVASAVEGAR